MFKKLIFGIAALFLIFVGGLILLMSYAFNNPEKIFDAFTSVTDRVMQGQPYEETGEFFLQGIESLVINTRAIPIKASVYSGTVLKIRLQGKVPRFDQGPFLVENLLNTSLAVNIEEPLAGNWMNLNVNGEEYTSSTDSELIAEVYIPASYTGTIEIGTTIANIEFKTGTERLYEVEISTRSGKITNDYKPAISEAQETKATPLTLRTGSGSITLN